MARPALTKIAFVSSGTPDADAARAALARRYGDVSFEHAEAVVALGGDGHMLQTLHRAMDRELPVYGMNFGSIGFLMNDFAEDRLLERIQAAEGRAGRDAERPCDLGHAHRLAGFADRGEELERASCGAAHASTRKGGAGNRRA